MAERIKHTADTIDQLIRVTGRLQHVQRQHDVAVQAQQEADRAAALQNVEHEGFCVKCRDKRTVVTAGEATHKNGMKSIYGSCPDCNTNVHRFMPKEKPADGG